MAKKRVFISFDYDHDLDLKILLAGQAKNAHSPFEIADVSIKERIPTNWKAKARTKIKGCDVMVVICGLHTDTAAGVSAEMRLAQETGVGVAYFLLSGRKDKICKKPTAAKSSDKMYKWTWDNLKALIGGAR